MKSFARKFVRFINRPSRRQWFPPNCTYVLQSQLSCECEDNLPAGGTQFFPSDILRGGITRSAAKLICACFTVLLKMHFASPRCGAMHGN